MKPGIVQRIFNDHYPALAASRPLDDRSRWAARNIRTCRTPEQGYHIDACPNGDYRIRLNNSCGHRACPLCGATDTELWLERQSAKELRCPHHQVVFTSPADLRTLWRWNRKAFTGLYFRAAWHTLREDGRMLVTTCSILPSENDGQIGKFLNRHSDASIQTLDHVPGFNTEFGKQHLPNHDGGDGFYYALLVKSGASGEKVSA